MKSGFNYGLLFTAGGVGMLIVAEQVMSYLARRSERSDGATKFDVARRLERAEAALREANEEIANVRQELATRR